MSGGDYIDNELYFNQNKKYIFMVGISKTYNDLINSKKLHPAHVEYIVNKHEKSWEKTK